jgi:redox-sensitive bicupin YhaK (pirin superfamily)
MKTSIAMVIEPRVKDLGDGFVVRRLLPHGGKKMVGPFIFWDHMGPVALKDDLELKVRAHPHIGLATITYLFKGMIMHRDSLGNTQPIYPGEVNWMTAGRGIVHSERTKPDQEPIELEGIQLWVALPKDQEDCEPDFVHAKEEDLPMLDVEGTQLRLITGEAFGKTSPVPVHSDLFYLNAKSKEASRFSHTFPKDQEGAIYLAKGTIAVEGKTFQEGTMIVFEKGSSFTLDFKQNSEWMLFGGKPFEEDRHIWWNLVSSDPAKIEAAKRDWKENRFPPVIDETEFTPLPE